MTLEDPPHESPRPPTLEASHLLTGPTGCPGFEFSGLLGTIRRRARHRVTICRELRHSVQIVKSEHVVTDRVAFWQCLGAKGRYFLGETAPGLSSMGRVISGACRARAAGRPQRYTQPFSAKGS